MTQDRNNRSRHEEQINDYKQSQLLFGHRVKLAFKG